MKKHLIAAAVAAAVAVPAMAQVTVSGVLDVTGVGNAKVTTQTAPGAAEASTKENSTAGNNGWSTSQIVFSGTEDLGGGLKASFAVATGLDGGTKTFADRDRFLALAGGFGTVRLGGFGPASATGYHGYTATNLSSAGSLYGVSQGTASTLATANNFGGGGVNFERSNNNIQYTTPNLNGFTANVNIRTNSSDTSADAGKTESTQQGLHVQYAVGPLSIGAARNDVKAEVQAVDTVAAVLGTTTANGVLGTAAVARSSNKSSLTWVGGQYNFGVATVGFVNIKRDRNNTTAAGVTTRADDLSINAVGLTVPFGALTVRLGAYEGDNDLAAATTDDIELSGHQASATYTLSKRTFAYAVMGEQKSTRAGTNTGVGARKRTTSVIGLSHSF